MMGTSNKQVEHHSQTNLLMLSMEMVANYNLQTESDLAGSVFELQAVQKVTP